MNYQKIYEQIIMRAKSRILNEYSETHHITPKCLGGNNDKSNLVNLTPEEHFIAHQLLVKMYPTHEGLLFALRFMATKNAKHKRNNKEYGWIKRRISALRKDHTLSVGEKNGMFGKKHTQETKQKQSEKAKERDPSFYDFARLPKADSHKKSMQKSRQVCRYILTDPAGKEHIFDRIADASKFCGISNSVLVKLAGNRYMFDHCRNWKISAMPL
jgi:hypothetical protein